jgi:hypothetical protein
MSTDPKDLSIHDEVVVETELDGGPFSVTAFVTNVVGDELWLASRLPEPRLAELIDGQIVHLVFDHGGALIVESVFLRRLGGSKLGSEKSRVFAVRRPQGVDTVQRRAHVRIDLERTVRIRSLGSLEVDRIGTGRTINIGAGGVLFTTDMPLILGEQLRIALVLTSRDIVIAGGTIVRIEDDRAADGAAPAAGDQVSASRVAVRFDKITGADQERITYHILSAHRQRKTTPLPIVARVSGTPAIPAETQPPPPADLPTREMPPAVRAEAEAQALRPPASPG